MHTFIDRIYIALLNCKDFFTVCPLNSLEGKEKAVTLCRRLLCIHTGMWPLASFFTPIKRRELVHSLSFIFCTAGQRGPEQWKAVVDFSLHCFVHLRWGRQAAAPPSDLPRGFGAGAAIGRVEGPQDGLLCAGWLAQTCVEVLWALWKLSEQTDLFTSAQDTDFGPRHALVVLPVEDAASGKEPPGTRECSAWRSSQSSCFGNLSHIRGESSTCKVGWVSALTASVQE